MATMEIDTSSGTPGKGRVKAVRPTTSTVITSIRMKIHAVPSELSI